MRILATTLLFIALVVALFITMRAPVAWAEPHAQSTATRTPTDEPPKPPYVFPTPIFIPTYPGDTPAPSVRTTPILPVTGATTYTVVSGDSPWNIAQKVYGDGSKYPLILDANNMTKDTRLRVGSVLQIPPLPGSAPVATPAATIASVQPTPAPPTLAPGILLTATPFRPLTPGATTTPTPSASMMIPSQVFDVAPTILNVLAGIFFIAALGCGIFTFLLFNRTRRMEGMNTRKKRLTIRQ
jgi:LysM repeat protein